MSVEKLKKEMKNDLQNGDFVYIDAPYYLMKADDDLVYKCSTKDNTFSELLNAKELDEILSGYAKFKHDLQKETNDYLSN